MPYLEDISYSRDECIAIVRDYYQFLTSLYLDEEYIIEPPEGGWPTITTDSLRGLGKTDEVIELLRHLPYIAVPSDETFRAHGAPKAVFADWQEDARITLDGYPAEDLRSVSEGIRRTEHVPPSVVGLTAGGRENRMLLLDTEHGVVYWPDCPDEASFVPSREQLGDDPYDWAPEKEAQWRDEGGAWAVEDFFEMFKDQFRTLQFIPVSRWNVIDVYTSYGSDKGGMVPMLQDIYRAHGWPDLERYRKQDCLRAVQKALEEHHPGMADGRGEED
jgi:hypothetical protein